MKDLEPQNLKYGRLDGSLVLHSNVQIPVSDVHMSDLLWQKLDKYTDRVLLVSGSDGTELTGCQIKERATVAASVLSMAGVKEGDVVLTQLPDGVDSACLLLAMHATAAVFAPCDIWMTGHEVLHMAKELEPRFLLCMEGQLERMLETASQCQSVVAVCVLASNGGDARVLPSSLRPGLALANFDWSHEVDKDLQLPVPVTKSPAEAVLFVAHSSGSTGRSKCLMVSNSSTLASVLSLEAGMVEIQDRVDISVDSYAHSIGIWTLEAGLLFGHKQVIQYYDQLVPSIPKYRITSSWIQVSDLMMLLEANETPAEDIRSLKMVRVSGIPSRASLVQRLRAKAAPDTHLVFNYGTTESGPISETPTDLVFEGRDGCVGALMSRVSVRIRDMDTGLKNLSFGQKGMIEVSGSRVTPSYFQNPEANLVNFDDTVKWFKTGDIGYFDSDGLLYLVGRTKDVIKVWGIQIPPVELEDVLLTHEAVAEAAVIGVPHETEGEVPRAFVTLKQGFSSGEEIVQNIRAHVDERVAEYKRLAGGVTVLESMPRIGIRKINRKILRAMAAEEAAAKA